MRRQSGFTIAEAIVLFAVIVLLVVMFSPTICGHSRGPANRTVCANNLKGIHQAMSTYAVTNNDQFPYASPPDPSRPVQGIRGRQLRPMGVTTMPHDQPAHINNATAALWVMVRDGMTSTKQYVCPSAKGNMKDPLTIDGTPAGKPAPLNQTWDFYAANHLSYSMINMYQPGEPKRWNASVSAEWVVLSDDNNNDEPLKRHTHRHADNPTAKQKLKHENSTNHKGEGQNFMFGDGHAEFKTDPFVGPSNDNVFADDEAETIDQPERPRPLASLRNDTPLTPVERNIVLLSIEGNGGVNLSR